MRGASLLAAVLVHPASEDGKSVFPAAERQVEGGTAMAAFDKSGEYLYCSGFVRSATIVLSDLLRIQRPVSPIKLHIFFLMKLAI